MTRKRTNQGCNLSRWPFPSDTRSVCSAGEWIGAVSIELGVWPQLFRDDSR